VGIREISLFFLQLDHGNSGLGKQVIKVLDGGIAGTDEALEALVGVVGGFDLGEGVVQLGEDVLPVQAEGFSVTDRGGGLLPIIVEAWLPLGGRWGAGFEEPSGSEKQQNKGTEAAWLCLAVGGAFHTTEKDAHG
jgi:hypothetical protein